MKLALLPVLALCSVAQTYTDAAGYGFAIPSGWQRLAKTSPAGCVLLSDGVDARVSICGRHDQSTTETVEHALSVSPDEHLQQYKTRDQMRLRQGSTQWSHIQGRQALTAVFDYNVGNQPVAELMTWVQSESTRLHVRVTVPGGANLDAVRQRIQPLLDSVRIP